MTGVQTCALPISVGVTVTTEPPNGGIASCIAGAVRRMSFPSNPKLDIATTRF